MSCRGNYGGSCRGWRNSRRGSPATSSISTSRMLRCQNQRQHDSLSCRVNTREGLMAAHYDAMPERKARDLPPHAVRLDMITAVRKLEAEYNVLAAPPGTVERQPL